MRLHLFALLQSSPHISQYMCFIFTFSSDSFSVRLHFGRGHQQAVHGPSPKGWLSSGWSPSRYIFKHGRLWKLHLCLGSCFLSKIFACSRELRLERTHMLGLSQAQQLLFFDLAWDISHSNWWMQWWNCFSKLCFLACRLQTGLYIRNSCSL